MTAFWVAFAIVLIVYAIGGSMLIVCMAAAEREPVEETDEEFLIAYGREISAREGDR